MPQTVDALQTSFSGPFLEVVPSGRPISDRWRVLSPKSDSAGAIAGRHQ